MSRTTDPDRIAELEEERTFLLRSLADLEREHAAGDVDEVDYRALRDGYTVRAAATLREIEAGEASRLPEPPANWRRRIAVLLGAAALIAVVWWVLAATTAQRLPDQTITGADPRDERQLLLAQARALQFSQPGVAADVYGQVLDLYPDDVEALAYRGWTRALDSVAEAEAGATPEATQAQLRAAIDDLARAAELDPNYPDPRCFLGIVQFRFLGQPDAARPDIDACLAFNPPADIRQLIEGMLASPASTVAGTTAPTG
jgi:hypothetical protein